ncbi:hypothetical protein [Salegentibacter sp. UBA1130]|uniref:hypothetical protein n=1 Tax=Salegentibacter sp. UBA1130 TaxID=1947451 RepID=UPI00257FA9AE|nr:hypothetical protein [Salegentibacter sp. UBA1130]
MIAIDKAQVDKIIKKRNTELKRQHNRAYDKLEKLKKNNILSHKESHILRRILRGFKKFSLVTLSINEMVNLSEEIGIMPKTPKRKFAGKNSKTFLKDEILKALGYETKRGSFYPEYFSELGIKSCVYCNSQLTLSLKKEKIGTKKKYIAKFQVDHYYPKAKYPYLSIALFNLYPTCASCNNAKKDDDIQFQLYQERHEINHNLMGFELDQAQKSKFLVTRESREIEYTFFNKTCPEYDEKFHITEIYKSQKDVAEDIILKSQTYDKNLRKQLKKFENINDAHIDRIILGNYTNPNEIHKRPMAKFMQDIAREAGLKISL